MANTQDKVLKALVDAKEREMKLLEKGGTSVDYAAGVADTWDAAITLITNMNLPGGDSETIHPSQDLRGVTQAIERLAQQTSYLHRGLQMIR